MVARRNRRAERAFRAGRHAQETLGEPAQFRYGLADAAGMAAGAFGRQRAAHQGQRQGQAAGQFYQLAGGGGFVGHGFRREGAQQGQAFFQAQLVHVGDGVGGAGKGAGQRGLARGKQVRTAGRVHLAEHGQRRPFPGVIEDEQGRLAAARQCGSNGAGQGARVGIRGHVHAKRVGPPAQHGIGSLRLFRSRAEIAPEDAAAEVREDVGIVGQGCRERRLAHAGQPAHGGNGRIRAVRAVHQARLQVGQRAVASHQ